MTRDTLAYQVTLILMLAIAAVALFAVAGGALYGACGWAYDHLRNGPRVRQLEEEAASMRAELNRQGDALTVANMERGAMEREYGAWRARCPVVDAEPTWN
jgi:hypothetical protein